MYFHGYHSFAPAPLLNIFGFYVYISYRPLARVVSQFFHIYFFQIEKKVTPFLFFIL